MMMVLMIACLSTCSVSFGVVSPIVPKTPLLRLEPLSLPDFCRVFGQLKGIIVRIGNGRLSSKATFIRSRAFTLIELLVVLGVIAVLLAILLPVLFAMRERGRRAVCLSNLHQLDTALLMYTQDIG